MCMSGPNKDEETIDIPCEHLKATRVNYPNNCRSLALKSIPALEGKHIQQLFLQIGSLENHAVEIQLGGVTLDCRRNIREHSLQSNGDAIRLDRENVSRAYMVNISQRVFVEKDPANGCRDYPQPGTSQLRGMRRSVSEKADAWTDTRLDD